MWRNHPNSTQLHIRLHIDTSSHALIGAHPLYTYHMNSFHKGTHGCWMHPTGFCMLTSCLCIFCLLQYYAHSVIVFGVDNFVACRFIAWCAGRELYETFLPDCKMVASNTQTPATWWLWKHNAHFLLRTKLDDYPVKVAPYLSALVLMQATKH